MIEVLRCSVCGRTAEAKARGEAFKQRHPNSGHNRRIDVLLGQ